MVNAIYERHGEKIVVCVAPSTVVYDWKTCNIGSLNNNKDLPWLVATFEKKKKKKDACICLLKTLLIPNFNRPPRRRLTTWNQITWTPFYDFDPFFMKLKFYHFSTEISGKNYHYNWAPLKLNCLYACFRHGPGCYIFNRYHEFLRCPYEKLNFARKRLIRISLNDGIVVNFVKIWILTLKSNPTNFEF